MSDFSGSGSEVSRENNLVKYLKEVNRRRVVRAASTYAIANWLILQIADICIPVIGLPEWTLTLTALLGILGFPMVIAMAWIFQITSEGLTIDRAQADSGDPPRFRRLALDASLLTVGCLLTAIASAQLLA